MKMRSLLIGIVFQIVALAVNPSLFSQTGIQAYVTDNSNDLVAVFDTNAPYAQLSTIPLQAGSAPNGIVFNPGNNSFYVGVNQGVDVIPNGQTSFTTISLLTRVFDLAVTPDGSLVYATNDGLPGEVYAIDASMNTLIATILTSGAGPLGIAITPVAITPPGLATGFYAYVAIGTGNVDVIDVNPSSLTYNHVVHTIYTGRELSNPFGIAITSDGSSVFFSNDGGTNVGVIITATNVLNSYSVGTGPTGVAIANSNAYVANFSSGTLSVNSTSSPFTPPTSPIDLTTITPSDANPRTVAATPDLSTIFVAGASSSLSIVDTASNTLITNVTGPANALGIAMNGPAITPQAPLPPSNLAGKLKKVVFVTQTEYIHHLTWSPSPSTTVAEYILSRNGKQIAVIPASGPFEYNDQNRKKNEKDLYSLVAVNAAGQASTPITLVFQ